MLLGAVFVIAACGLVYELIAGAIAGGNDQAARVVTVIMVVIMVMGVFTAAQRGAAGFVFTAGQ